MSLSQFLGDLLKINHLAREKVVFYNSNDLLNVRITEIIEIFLADLKVVNHMSNWNGNNFCKEVTLHCNRNFPTAKI